MKRYSVTMFYSKEVEVYAANIKEACIKAHSGQVENDGGLESIDFDTIQELENTTINLNDRINNLLEKEKIIRNNEKHKENVLHNQLYSKMENLIPKVQELFELDRKLKVINYYRQDNMETNKCLFTITDNGVKKIELKFGAYWMRVEVNEYGVIMFDNTENNGIEKKISYENELMETFLKDFGQFQEKAMNMFLKNIERREAKVNVLIGKKLDE